MMRLLGLFILLVLATVTLTFPLDATEKGSLPRVFLGLATLCHDQPALGQTWLEVTRIVPGGPAERAGVQQGDQIIAFNEVPFRFATDAQQMRSLSWIEPDQPLQLSVMRQGERIELTLIPEAASADQLQRLAAWLEDFEARGDRSCSEQEDPLVVEWHALKQRILEAGGEATILVERLPGEPPTFKVSSQPIELPEGFDWKAHWPSYDILAQRIAPGQNFVITISVEPHRSVVDAHSDYVKEREM